MPSFEDAQRDVREDIAAGIGTIFGPYEDSKVRVPDELDGPINHQEGDVITVPWIYEAEHNGDFQGLLPTFRLIEVHGVTVVNYSKDAEKPTFHRYVDWLGVVNQLGLVVSWRVPVDEPQYREGKELYRRLHPDDTYSE